jgi:hypothetical protein
MLPPEIRAFFETYREAFNRLDGKAVARLYAVPSGIAADSGYKHWSSLEPIIENMANLCRLYADNGFVSAVFEPVAFINQGHDFAVADLSWSIARTRGLEPLRFKTTYNLMRTADGWRVFLSTAYQEKTLRA